MKTYINYSLKFAAKLLDNQINVRPFDFYPPASANYPFWQYLNGVAMDSYNSESKGTIGMRSNGFGTGITRVVVSVAISDLEKAEIRIGTPPFKITDEPPRACFEVSTSAGRGGDDERIVYEIAHLLDGGSDPVEWNILWEDSEY